MDGFGCGAPKATNPGDEAQQPEGWASQASNLDMHTGPTRLTACSAAAHLQCAAIPHQRLECVCGHSAAQRAACRAAAGHHRQASHLSCPLLVQLDHGLGVLLSVAVRGVRGVALVQQQAGVAWVPHPASVGERLEGCGWGSRTFRPRAEWVRALSGHATSLLGCIRHGHASRPVGASPCRQDLPTQGVHTCPARRATGLPAPAGRRPPFPAPILQIGG